jgi:hypothetical protein
MKRGLQQVVTTSALVVLFALEGPALAGFYNITKVVTWDIDKVVNGVHTPYPGPMKSILFAHTFNDDNHPGGAYHIDNVPTFPLVPGNPYTDSIVTSLAFQQPVKTDHVYWSAPHSSPQDTAGSWGTGGPPSPWLITRTHITTDAAVSFSWPAPVPGAGGRYELTTTINANGSAVKNSTAHAGETAYGEAASGGSVTVRGVLPCWHRQRLTSESTSHWNSYFGVGWRGYKFIWPTRGPESRLVH